MSGVFDEKSVWNAASADSALSFNTRIVCIAIAAYDFLITIPAEWRMYRSSRRTCISTPAVLFFLLRYVSVLVFIIGNYLHWAGDEFSENFCRRFWFLPAVFKCLQVMTVQVILGWRTYKISRRNRKLLYFLAVLYLLVVSMQWFTSLFDRHMKRVDGYCASGNAKYDVMWGFYFSSSVWDVATLVISLWFLLRIKSSSPLISKLARTMIADGLIYFVAMTAVNVVNMFIFLNSDNPVRNGSVTVAYTGAWIFSQRILININDAAAAKRAAATFPTKTMTVSTGSTSAEALSQEVTTRLRSAQLDTGLISRSYPQQLQGTIESSSGGYLDSFITIDIKPHDPEETEGTSRGMLSGGSGYPAGDKDPLKRAGDCETGHTPSEGPLMTTRKF